MMINMTPIKTAICSFGMSGRVFHAPFLHVNPGFEFYSVWEREKNLAKAIYPDVKVVRTYEELLSDPAVELVIVNTPNYTHYDYAKQALTAGKPHTWPGLIAATRLPDFGPDPFRRGFPSLPR